MDDTKPETPAASPAPAAIDPQQEHDEAVAWLLMLRLSGCETIESASEWFEANWEKDRQKLLDAVRRGDKGLDQDVTMEDIIHRAALLTDVEYAQDRAWVADAADMRVTDVDKFVAERRPKTEDVVARRIAATIPNVEPWPEPIDGAHLLDEVAATLRRFVIFDRVNDADVIAVWSLGTHCFDIFNIFPRLGITSPESECGKSTVLELLDLLVARPILSSSVTPAVVFRIIERERPTLLVDELDTFAERYPELDGVFNSGHKAGASVLRVEKIDDQLLPCRFATFAPLAYGRIGPPKGTLANRSLKIHLMRKDRSEKTDSLRVHERHEQAQLFTRLRRQLARWALDNRERVQEQRPDTGELSNRERDNWLPLFEITAVASGGWLDKMHAAAGNAPRPSPFDDSDAVRLLRDIRNIFHTRRVKQLTSERLIADLLLQRESGWEHYRHERDPLDQRGLGKLLGTFAIHSKNLRSSQGELGEKRPQVQSRGYRFEQFTRMFAKFLGGEEPEEVEVSR